MREIDSLAYWQERGLEFFRELSTFGAMPDEAIRKLFADGRVLSLDAGEILYSVGDRSEAFFIVLSGRTGTWMPRKDGGMTLARCHQPGDDMGFVPMIALADRPGNGKADEASLVLEISCGQFLDFHQQEPEAFGLMLLNLVRGMARSIITMATMLADQDAQLHRFYEQPPRPWKNKRKGHFH